MHDYPSFVILSFPNMYSKQSIVLLSSSSPVHFIFYALVAFLTFTVVLGGNETDHQALLNIKSMITKDPYGALTSWNNSLHFCDWFGVICGKRHRRVMYLRLRSQGLEGTLSPYVGNLSFLRGIFLINGTFQGTIPHEMSRLSRLRVLSLGLNKFHGVIPANISSCSNLEVIDVSDNELVGSIPKEISFLSKLTFVSLQGNKFTGGIPLFLGNLTSMQVFAIKENPLGGSIPNTLGHWKNLQEIYIGACNLSGVIPHTFYNLSLLAYVSMFDNQLTGSLPSTIGAMFPNLVLLELWGNQLTGPLPQSISNCSRLADLGVSKNKLSGKLTIDFANLRDIYFISLYSNQFGSQEADEMRFIDSLKNCTKLETLDFSYCNFQGVLPSSIGNLSNQLEELYLYANQLHGSLPSSIGNLVGLNRLHLDRNQFTGNIPSTVGNLQKLKAIYLYKNQLSGHIPDAIGNLSSLITVSLFSNKLEGVIPSSLGNCHSLLELYLNDNKINGNIPKKVLQLSSLSIRLNLSQNNLSGALPIEVGDLKMLAELDLSENSLSGYIPSSLGDCGSLSSLSLKDNLFEGKIPSSFISLKGLVELDISHNKLSGQIPKFLQRLQYLNLSYNDFEGEVPTSGVFSNATTFSVLGNNRLCDGFIDLGLPKCKDRKKHKPKLPMFVIVILIASTLFTIICLAYAWCKKKKKNKQSESAMIKPHLKVSYNQLLKATNGFSEANLIGKGGFSSVYKGILDEYDDRFVAVKVIHLQNQGASKSFMRECEAWRNIRHRNLLKIITSCSSIDFKGNDFKALVYEFMPNGSLYDWLHPTSRLNILQIINILIDVASALDYIHNHCMPSIVHGDLKPSNILLDDDMVGHVGDFGLARFLDTSYQNSSSGIRGTIGYAAPEYGLGNEMTTSADVYSFGILLLEALTGKAPTDKIFNEDLNLHMFASMALPDHVIDIVNANILDVYQDDGISTQKKEANAKKIDDCLASTIKIGISCTVDSPSQRMNIEKVRHELQHILETLQNTCGRDFIV